MDPFRQVPVQICSNTLKFAKCSSFKCQKRHAFINEVDQPKFLPTEGTLKISLFAVKNPALYIIKIDEVKISEKSGWISWKKRNDDVEQKLKEFNEHMKKGNHVIHAAAGIGDICAYFSSHNVKWYRAKVLSTE